MTKRVQLSDCAYKLLKNRKKPGETFSDVITRAFAARGGPMALFGLGRLDPDESYLHKMDEADRRRAHRSTRRR